MCWGDSAGASYACLRTLRIPVLLDHPTCDRRCSLTLPFFFGFGLGFGLDRSFFCANVLGDESGSKLVSPAAVSVVMGGRSSLNVNVVFGTGWLELGMALEDEEKLSNAETLDWDFRWIFTLELVLVL